MENWESYVRRVTPYVPGEQPSGGGRVIKLNTNENPYPPAPGVRRALREMDLDRLRLYPDPACSPLVEAIADYYGIKKGQVFCGVGSDDVLAMIYLTFFNSGKPILFPDITYSFYDVWARMLCVPYETRPLDGDFRIRPEDYYGENGGVIFPNPNAPTGILMPLSEVEDIISHNRDVVVVADEAYVDFGGESALPLIERYDNLLIVQTFSKSRSLAGMRIGFAMGSERLISCLSDVKYSFNSYTLSQAALALGTEAIRDRDYFEETRKKVMETREWAKGELAALGFSFADSASNFIFVTHPKARAAEIFKELRERGIYVRHFDKPRIDNYLRISIGTREEMEELVKALREVLGARV